MKALWKVLSTASILLLTSLGAAQAQNNSALDAAIEDGLRCEAAGMYGLASAKYSHIARAKVHEVPWGDVDSSLRSQLCRRSIACLVREAQSKPSLALHQKIMGEYKLMTNLEPNNAAWPFLAAKGYAMQGNFVSADDFLKTALEPQRGPASVRQKVKAYLSANAGNIARGHANDNIAAANVRKEIERPLDWFVPGEAIPPPIHSNRESGGGGSGSYTGLQNAERNGDWGAADRFRNGTDSWSDQNRYVK